MSNSDGFGDRFVLTYLTDDPRTAAHAAAAGVDRIGPDIEIVGKNSRQAHLSTRISAHDLACLPAIRAAIGDATLFVRVNPIHEGSHAEIEEALARGVGNIMLPYFHTVEEVQQFVEMVAGRAITTLLVETGAAALEIERILAVPGVDEIHVGLTDMMLSLRTGSRFRILTSWFLEALARTVLAAGKPLHLAGIGRLKDPRLPIPSDLILSQYPRLGAQGALVTRIFTDGLESAAEYEAEVRLARDRLSFWGNASTEKLEQQHDELERLLEDARRAGRRMP